MRILMIVNLRSGQGDAGLYDYVRALGRSGAEVTMRFLGLGAKLDHLLRDADSFDRVVAAGGDGTVSSVCHTLAHRKLPILSYPAGTANLLALNLNIPSDPLELAAVTLEGLTRDIDLGELTFGDVASPVGFIVAAGAGYDADIMATAQRYKSALGPLSYLVGALQHLTPTVSKFTLELDDRTVISEGMAVLVMNVVRVQFDLALTRSSDPGDGLFEVVVLRTKNVPELIPAVWGAFLDRFIDNPERSAGLEVHTARYVRIDADPPLRIQYDGEVVDATTPLVARSLPGAARMIVPEGSLALGRQSWAR